MKRNFKQTCIHGFQSYGFWLSVVLVILCCLLSQEGPSYWLNPKEPKTILSDMFFYSREQKLAEPVFNAVTVWRNSQGKYIGALLTVIASLPCVITYCDELSGGYYKFELMRVSRKEYIFGKILGNCLCSAAALFIGLILTFGIFSIFFPSVGSYDPDSLFAFPEGPFSASISKLVLPLNGCVYVLYQCILHSLFAAVISIIPIAVATFFPNKYFVLCFPLLLTFFLEQFYFYIWGLTQTDTFAKWIFVPPYYYFSVEQYISQVIIYCVIFVLITLYLFKRRTSRA